MAKAKVNPYERRIARLKKQRQLDADTHRESVRHWGTKFAELRDHYAGVVAKHLATERGLNTTIEHHAKKILEDAFRIQELGNQVAVQEHMEGLLNLRARRIAELERSLLNRLWVAIPTQWARFCQLIATQLTTRRNRIVNRFKIWRLNRARVEAISEAGYIPEKLVKIAERYWEEDQKRLKIDEQIRNIHYGNEHTGIAQVERVCKPSIWRRIAIILGRA